MDLGVWIEVRPKSLDPDECEIGTWIEFRCTSRDLHMVRCDLGGAKMLL